MAEPKTINFRDERQRELFDIAMLGEQVRAFLLTDPIGQHLHRRAKHTIQQAEADALAVEVDGIRGWLYGRRKLLRIQQRAQAARFFINWLGEAIVDGEAAAKAILGETDEDE